ncbi:isopentenyl-diphosphate Delta-isomerase [Thermostaphylospora chromogena]|uniref:isopentenyl-diphosphate Delta-isomerase n=1 Tax=Thermostaphylospora chromogena TaxID=35622 RepID=UPI000B8518D3|nr:isopentenyl-diphosphate Delta-isomerase [Thermostaphylospora chromogena]
MTEEELVVLVAPDGRAIGSAPKELVHGTDTPLHLAFSSYVFDTEGRVLLTRRANRKITWPGVWTNSCCGHPMPGERLVGAVVRRLSHELGLTALDIDLMLPRFAYRAVMDNGTVENELCPVYRVVVAGEATPNPDEVGEVAWRPWKEFADEVMSGELTMSPWCSEQVPQLVALGPDPLKWEPADPAALPEAALR